MPAVAISCRLVPASFKIPCHCEAGNARRGNPYPPIPCHCEGAKRPWQSPVDFFLRLSKFPVIASQSADWRTPGWPPLPLRGNSPPGNPYSFWNDFVNVTDHHGRQTAAEKRRHYTFRTKSYPFRSINRCSAAAKIEVFLRLNYVNQHCRRCAPGGVWGGGFDCGSNQLKPSPAGFFGSFLAGTRKLPSGGTAPTAPPKGIVFGAKGSPTTPVIARRAMPAVAIRNPLSLRGSEATVAISCRLRPASL